MKLKGISKLEQHIEKIVVAVFAVACLGVVAYQFVGPRNTATVGPGNEVPLDQAMSVVERKAKEVEGQIASSRTVPELPSVLGTNPTQQMLEPVSPVAELYAIGPTIDLGTGQIGPSVQFRFAQIRVPAPSAGVAAVHMGTIDPVEIERDASVASVLPPSMPFDKASVSVEWTFDGTELASRLRQDPDGPDGQIRPLPDHWWSRTTTILHVQAERQRLDPATGQWGEVEPVQPMPGRERLAPRLRENVGLGEMRQMIALAMEDPTLVMQPPYYAVMFGREWDRPAAMLASFGRFDRGLMLDARRADELALEIERLDTRIEKLREEIQGDRREPRERNRDPGGRGGRGDPERGTDNRSTRERTLETLERQRADKQEELGEILARLSGDQETDDQNPRDPAEPDDQEPMDLLEQSQAEFWVHDVHVDRGATYRYRARVWVSNPFFGQGAALVDEQKPLAEQTYIPSEVSAWSEPVEVFGERYFFVDSATAESINPLGRRTQARVDADLFEFRWGYWRLAKTEGIRPGDRIMGQAKVPDLEPIVLGNQPDDQEPTMQPIGIDTGAVLLGVAPDPGGNEGIAFVGENGQVDARDPTMEDSTALYLHLLESDRLGREAVRPRREVVDRRPDPRDDRPRPPSMNPFDDPRQPNLPPGGGGG